MTSTRTWSPARASPASPAIPPTARLRQELDAGALPFTTQGPENGLAIEGGLTLGYELVTDLAHDRLDHLIVQVGGGALASSAIQALREAADLGALARLPARPHRADHRCAPAGAGLRRVRALLPPEPAPDAIRKTMAEAAQHRSAFMQPWPQEPVSVATGILDDETYDWRAVVEGMLTTGGRPLVVSEDSLTQANRLVVARTGIPVDPTGVVRPGRAARDAALGSGRRPRPGGRPVHWTRERNAMTKRTYGGPLIDVAGAVDLHCHPYPDLFPRLADDFDIVRAARDAGMKAIVLKCHHENTVSRAYLVQRVIPGIRVFGGVVLNYYVGGINPAAVEASLKLGGKEVWMPTVDAGYHAEVHGGTGGYDSQQGGRSQAEGIWIADKEGKLRPEVKEVLELVAQYGAILATSHLAPREIVALVREARSVGVEKIVITHPYFRVPNLDLDTLEEVARMGAMPEFGYCTVSPAWQYAAPEKIVQSVERIGASRCLLVSDTGQRHNPLPSEALRIFAQTIFEKGVPAEEVTRMITHNPMQLLDVDANYEPSPADLAWARALVEDPCADPGLSGARRRHGGQVPVDGLTVREMLGQDAMRGARIIAGADGLDRVVRRLNVMTVPNIVRWTKQDEFLLTTGYPLPREPGEFGRLIEQLAAKGLAGLGVKLDEYLAEVPADAVDLADRAAFPIVVIPPTSPLDDVLSQTFETIVNRQAAALARRQQIHDAFLRVALTGGGLAGCPASWPILPGADVVICDPAGYPLAATRAPRPRPRTSGLCTPGGERPGGERPGHQRLAGRRRAQGRRDRHALGGRGHPGRRDAARLGARRWRPAGPARDGRGRGRAGGAGRRAGDHP